MFLFQEMLITKKGFMYPLHWILKSYQKALVGANIPISLFLHWSFPILEKFVPRFVETIELQAYTQ